MLMIVCILIWQQFWYDNMGDMLIISTNINVVNDMKKYLKKYLTWKFRIKDLNEVDIILGIKVKKKHN